MKSLIKKITRKFDSSSWRNVAIVATGITLALLLRYCLLPFRSWDYKFCTGIWYHTIKAEGFSALGSGFANYTPFYLYCLYFVSLVFPHISSVVATKLPSIAADGVCAWYAYRLVKLKYPGDSPWPFSAFLAVLFAPTVVLNSSLWGQADSLYTAALTACLYYLVCGRETRAMLAYGIAFAIKLQSVFLAPFLLIALLKRMLSWKHVMLIPVVYVLAALPSWLAGRPFWELVTIYTGQATQYIKLAMDVPNPYTWLPQRLHFLFYPAGLIGASFSCYLFVVVAYKSGAALTPQRLVPLALLSVMMMPFVLPRMHERYFYVGDVLSIIFAFYSPRYFYVPLVVGLSSFFSYQPYLFHRTTIPFSLLAIVQLFVIVVIARHVILALYGESNEAIASGPTQNYPEA